MSEPQTQDYIKLLKTDEFLFSKKDGRNGIRLIDENTIEVQLNNFKNMKTDIKFLDVCIQNKIFSGKVKNKEKYYVMIIIEDKPLFFDKYITGFKVAIHQNKNPYDNRLCNLKEKEKKCRICHIKKTLSLYSKHSGTKDKLDSRCKECVKIICKKRRGGNTTLPQTLTVKVCTICKESKPVEEYNKKGGRTTLDDRCKKCMANMNKERRRLNVKTKEYIPKEINLDSKDWQQAGANRIKIIDSNTIEVELTKGQTMLTDMQFLDLCKRRKLCATKNSTKNARYYAAISIDSKLERFHGHITGFKMVDHINGNPLDNRLCNLRETTVKQNNNNRHRFPVKIDGLPPGVRLIRDRPGDAFQARIKQDGTEYTRSFGIKKYGYEEAKRLALEAREEFLKKFNSNNRLPTVGCGQSPILTEESSEGCGDI